MASSLQKRKTCVWYTGLIHIQNPGGRQYYITKTHAVNARSRVFFVLSNLQWIKQCREESGLKEKFLGLSADDQGLLAADLRIIRFIPS